MIDRDTIIKLAREVADPNTADVVFDNLITLNFGEMERFAAMVAAAEREACAKLASEPQYWPLPNFTHPPSERTMGRIEGEKEMSRRIASAIRARSIT